ncbi:hypothetical protein EYZ11_009245 [Aspergillus tanneri]|uniref:Amidase domain-containing protein n=1 Tax=Aspergillus tanneri TaxID=1220188 RepID=A0A4S3J8U6_9EURO|nr:hypothetical protein EYZ11_009245 [Aspergillus tanneri]
MTELWGLKSTPSGREWIYAVCLHPDGFHPDDLFMGRSGPGGSSSGSTVGVLAGFAPLALETDNGLGLHGKPVGLYPITATRKTVPTDGVFTLSREFDKLGGMAKSPKDMVLLIPITWNAFMYQKDPDEDVEKQMVTSVQELVDYNASNAGCAMPQPHADQADLVEMLRSNLTEKTAAAAKAHGKRLAGRKELTWH